MQKEKFKKVFDFEKKSKIKASEGLNDGKFPFYTSSPTQSKYLNDSQINGHCLVFGTGGNPSVHFTEGSFTVSTDCLVAKVKEEFKELIDPKYIYYYFISSAEILENGFRGIGLKHISKGYIGDIEIPIISIQEQREIVKELNRVGLLIRKRKESINFLDEYLRSVFLDMFGDLFRNTKNWEFVSFGEYIELLTDYHSNGSYESLRDHVTLLSKPDYALMVRTTDLENNNFTKGVNYINQEAYHFLEKSKVFGNEIIINKIGSAGKVYLMPELNRPVSLGMNAFLLRFKNGVNSKFIYYLLNSEYGKEIIRRKIKGAVTKTIRKDAVRSLMVPKVSTEVQEEFVRKVKEVESLRKKSEMQLSQLEDLFNIQLKNL